LAAAICAALAFAGCGGSSTAVVEAPANPPQRTRRPEAQPPHPDHLDVATAAQDAAAKREAAEAKARKLQAREPEPEPVHEPSEPPRPGSLSAACAGTSGSYTPPPPSQRKKITPRVIERLEQEEAEGRAVLLSGIALAPPSAPARIKAAISAAN